MEHHNIKESEQLALLSLSDVTMTERESKTQNITPIITGKAAGTGKHDAHLWPLSGGFGQGKRRDCLGYGRKGLHRFCQRYRRQRTGLGG